MARQIISSRPYKHSAFLFLFSAFIILILLPLFQQGTFIDGQLYKTVAFNDAIGAACFWNMKYTQTCMPFFCEQPPLYPFLLGGFYKLFGTHYLVDRLFTLLLFIVFIGLMKLIVKQLFKNTSFYSGLLFFLMISVPVWCWSYVNQVIEPLVCVFTAMGILCFIRYLSSKKTIYIFLFAAAVYLSFLSKGFQSCFLIGLPAVYAMVSKFKKGVLGFVIVAGAALLVMLGLTLRFYQPAIAWFDCYYNARLVLTMQNIGNTTDDHFEIIVRFFTELIIPVFTLLFLLAYLKRSKKYPLKFAFKNFAASRLAVVLLITALLGSFPYAISLVQRGFYLIPSFICFLLALVYGFKRYWLLLYAFVFKIAAHKISRMALPLIFAGSVFYFCYACTGYKREEALLKDIALILPHLKQSDTVAIDGDLWNYFNLHSYLYIGKQVNLTTDWKNRQFLITNKNAVNDSINNKFTKFDLPTQSFDVFVIKK